MNDANCPPMIGATNKINTTNASTTTVMIKMAAASRLTPARSRRSVNGVSK